MAHDAAIRRARLDFGGVEQMKAASRDVCGTAPLESIGRDPMFFCLVTLVLAALGLYGVTAYAASQRTSEFGLRAALGADPGAVTRMVIGEASRVAILGILTGVPIGLEATRLIRRSCSASAQSTCRRSAWRSRCCW